MNINDTEEPGFCALILNDLQPYDFVPQSEPPRPSKLQKPRPQKRAGSSNGKETSSGAGSAHADVGSGGASTSASISASAQEQQLEQGRVELSFEVSRDSNELKTSNRVRIGAVSGGSKSRFKVMSEGNHFNNSPGCSIGTSDSGRPS